METIQRKIPTFEAQDLLVEVNPGSEQEHRMTKISGHFSLEQMNQVVDLIKKYKDCFTWDYHEMPDLDRKLVEHRLPVKEGCKPHKKPSRRFNPHLMPPIKDEIESR